MCDFLKCQTLQCDLSDETFWNVEESLLDDVSDAAVTPTGTIVCESC